VRSACGAASGEIRQEGTLIRAPGAFLVLSLLAGCGSSPKDAPAKKAPPKEEKTEAPKPTSINLGEGSADKMGGAQNQVRLWTVKWKSAQMDFYQTGKNFAGTLNDVTGSIYDNGSTASTFEGVRSRADKAKEVLILEGKVKVISQKPRLTLTCDRMTYSAKDRIVRAHGHVVVRGESGTISGLQDVWATPELDVLGSPEMFRKRENR
jgi:hypothetical protein